MQYHFNATPFNTWAMFVIYSGGAQPLSWCPLSQVNAWEFFLETTNISSSSLSSTPLCLAAGSNRCWRQTECMASSSTQHNRRWRHHVNIDATGVAAASKASTLSSTPYPETRISRFIILLIICCCYYCCRVSMQIFAINRYLYGIFMGNLLEAYTKLIHTSVFS